MSNIVVELTDSRDFSTTTSVRTTALQDTVDHTGEPEHQVTNKNEADTVPDGGYGWLVVFGAFLVQLMGYGIITSW